MIHASRSMHGLVCASALMLGESPMANFAYLKEADAYVNLDHVTSVNVEKAHRDGPRATLSIIDRKQEEIISGNDMNDLIAALGRYIK